MNEIIEEEVPSNQESLPCRVLGLGCRKRSRLSFKKLSGSGVPVSQRVLFRRPRTYTRSFRRRFRRRVRPYRFRYRRRYRYGRYKPLRKQARRRRYFRKINYRRSRLQLPNLKYNITTTGDFCTFSPIPAIANGANWLFHPYTISTEQRETNKILFKPITYSFQFRNTPTAQNFQKRIRFILWKWTGIEYRSIGGTYLYMILTNGAANMTQELAFCSNYQQIHERTRPFKVYIDKTYYLNFKSPRFNFKKITFKVPGCKITYDPLSETGDRAIGFWNLGIVVSDLPYEEEDFEHSIYYKKIYSDL